MKRPIETEEEELPPLDVASDSEHSSLEGMDSSEIDALSESEPEEWYTSDSSGELVEGADGKPRKLKPQIDPHYSSDDSDHEESNTVGNIPLSAYETTPHIGYDIDGKRIMRPATQSAIDSLLETVEMPKGWTGLVDKETGGQLLLSAEEQALIDRVQSGLLPNEDINPYEDQLEWFTNHSPEVTPLKATPEPKRRFVSSKHEAKTVAKLVRLIRDGKLVPGKPKPHSEPLNHRLYDVWSDEHPTAEERMHIPAPKLPPPTHEESYNPPQEYLLTEKERETWEATEPDERETNFVPQKYSALRKVPGYANGIRERFDRMLDLYLAPRQRYNKLQIDPDSLIPDLPSPEDLKPFPTRCSSIFIGHQGRVRCLEPDISGEYLATGGEDGSVRIWETITGRELWRLDILESDTYTDASQVHPEDRIDSLSWHPVLPLLAICAGENIFLVVPPRLYDSELENTALELMDHGYGQKHDVNKADWTKPGPRLAGEGCGVIVRCTKRVRHVRWHTRGDYFVTTQPDAGNSSVLIHQLSKHLTQLPFKKAKGLVQNAQFHPFKPQLYVASQRYVRIYDLQQQKLLKKLQPSVRWISSVSIHPQGDNVIVGSFDKRVTWHDLELSEKPYKTLRYHDRAVRGVAFHPRLPLFCSCADDGHINVLHCSVFDDIMKNPLLVPLKVLSGHKIVNNLGVLQVAWHPREAWLFSAGADGAVRLWT